MLLHSPILRDLGEWIEDKQNRTGNVPGKVYEIGVTAKKSLSWSIVLSALLLDGDEDSGNLLGKLVGSEEELVESKEKKKLIEEVTPEEIERFFCEFNPFRKKPTSSTQSPIICEIVRLFDLRLKQCANKMKTREDVWNDDLKLRVASQLLQTKIDVYFPDNSGAGRFKSYAKTASDTRTSIILFQYEREKYKLREDVANIFHFAMSQKYANYLKSNASEKLLKKSNPENVPRKEKPMLLLPCLRNLNDWNENENSGTDNAPREVWEIGVPAKRSLSWSIVLSVLLLDSDEDLASRLRKLVGSEEEQRVTMEKKNLMEEVTSEEIEQFFNEFNPFKSRHDSSTQSPKISEIVRQFDLRLNRYATKIKTGKDTWNDDLKLKAAAQLLQTTIDVYFSDDIEARRFKSYAETASNTKVNIILFQYENRELKSRVDAINVFHFAMSQKYADHLKLNTSEKFPNNSNAENILRREKRMLLLPPKLRNLNDWIKKDNSGTDDSSTEVWEIGVPAKKSLPWSIVLSVLLLDSNEDLADLLQKLIGSEEELIEIREKKNLTEEVTPKEIKIFLRKFNPFKNRYTSFTQSPNISEIVRIFDLRLKRHAKDMITREDISNDDLKLKVAAQLLQIKIDVYFPDDIEAQKFKRYPEIASNAKANIILFQYEDKEHELRNNSINVFYFAMSTKCAHRRKLDALMHFLKKAKVESLLRNEVLNLMNDPDAHGQAFLPTIINSNCVNVLPEIYESPYVAFKLSEAGFETNPIVGLKDNLSALCYASGKSDPIYLRVLYDYASNCSHLFDRSARRADDDVLENLTRIESIIERDINEVQRVSEDSDIRVNVLKQIRRFVVYQIEVARNMEDIKRSKLDSDEFKFRKSIIVSILEHYLNYFYYESVDEDSLTFQLKDYWNFSEYYECIDNFSFQCFFDNFFQLRICCGLKEENVVLNTEWNMFLAMMSNKYFPKFSGKNVLGDQLDMKDCGNNTLRYIPLYHRNVLGNEIKRFLRIIKPLADSRYLKEETVAKDSMTMSQIGDELIVQRLNKYIEAVFETSPESDKIKAVLVIERALQVLGESIKPPSSKTSIVSFLLRSCLEPTFQYHLILIRNDLSKYRSNSVYGKAETEKDYTFFEGIKSEFKPIRKVFQTVNFTQRLRIEESLINQALEGLEKGINLLTYRELKERYKIYKDRKITTIEKDYDGFIQLLYDSLTDLRENSKKLSNARNAGEQIIGQLKSIEFLITCIQKVKYERYLDALIFYIQHFMEENVNDNTLGLGTEEAERNHILIQIIEKLEPLLKKCADAIEKNNSVQQVKVSAPCISQFFNRLKADMFLSQEMQEIREAVVNAVSEAKEAQEEVKRIFSEKSYESTENIDDLLKKILLPSDKLSEIKICFENRDDGAALKYLEKLVSVDSIYKDLKSMLEEGSTASGYAFTLITKIAFQSHWPSKIYTSLSLPEETCEKLQFFVTKKANFLLMRLKSLNDILIEEDGEIRGTNKWGRSEPIKHHLKFLMRQRYQREKAICASLEMAYFDCMNILSEQSKGDDDSEDGLRSFYEKSKDLYAGINLRNTISHRQNIPETVGDILDEDDFPSEMIDKMYELIGDTEAIEAIFNLFRVAGVLKEKDFISAVENDGFKEHNDWVEVIKECPRWKSYLFLFPFIRT